MSTDLQPSDVVGFWKEAGPRMWFAKDDGFDDVFRQRFLHGHMMAARRELDHWAETPEGSLALLILLDQFPRNTFRGTAHQFATDPLARHFAEHAVARGHHLALPTDLRNFLLLPFEHSERLEDQDRYLALIGDDADRRNGAISTATSSLGSAASRIGMRAWAGRRRRRSRRFWMKAGSGGSSLSRWERA